MNNYQSINNYYKLAQRSNTYYFVMGKEITGKSVRESLKTNDFNVACERAKKRYNEYCKKYIPEPKTANTKSFAYLTEKFLKENPYPLHREYMNRLYIPYFSKKICITAKINDVSKITTKDINNYIKYRRTFKTKAGQIVKNSTIKREIQTLAQFFNWCYENSYIKKPLIMPTIKLTEIIRDENGNDVFECYDSSRDIFTPEEVKMIFNQYKKDISVTVNAFTKRRLILAERFCKLLYYTGFRTCDLKRTCWEQFELCSNGQGVLRNFHRKKQKDKRTVVLCPAATKILLEMKQEIIEFCKAHNLVFDEKTTPLFTLCNKKEGTEEYELKPISAFDSGFRGILKRCGIEKKGEKCLYSWRHTYISIKCMENVPPLKIAAHCGTSVAMIEKYYWKVNNLMNPEELFINEIDV